MSIKIEASKRIKASFENDLKYVAEKVTAVIKYPLKLIAAGDDSGTYAGTKPILALSGNVFARINAAVTHESFTLNVKSHPKHGICFEFIDG